MKRGLVVSIVAAALVCAGGVALGSGAYLYGKAEVGQWLMHRAWVRTQATGHASPPWPWADTGPLARLIVPGQHVDLLVLSGASGRTLAWGPAHLDHSAALGASGNAVISAHRDTHFRFLAHVLIGDALIVERTDGSRIVYRVTDIRILDARTMTLPRDTERPTLTLVTCYPFDAIVPGGPLRYVVMAEAEDGPPTLQALL
jgi:sortase A